MDVSFAALAMAKKGKRRGGIQRSCRRGRGVTTTARRKSDFPFLVIVEALKSHSLNEMMPTKRNEMASRKMSSDLLR